MSIRKSLKRSAMWAFCASLMLPSTIAFVSLSTQRRSFSSISSSSAAAASSASVSSVKLFAVLQPRLTVDEELELLRHAAEGKRLLSLAQSSSASSSSSLLLKSQQAGYGKDIIAYQEALEQAYRARETLVTRNMGLVHYCVKELVSNPRTLNSLSKEDLVQEGAIGLAQAIDKYNPHLGTKFSTYAFYWIRAAMMRCIAERDDMLRVPSHVGAAVRKMTQAAQRLGVELDGTQIVSSIWKEDATAVKTLAEEAGLTDHQLMVAMKVRQRRLTGGYVSYESWMQQGKSMQVDMEPMAMTNTATSTPEEKSQEKEKVRLTLSRFLRPKEMEALSWRYGLVETPNYLQQAEQRIFGDDQVTKGKWGEAMSFTEVGKHMSCSAEYGRKLCHKALDKLRQAAEAGSLEPAFLC